MSSRQAGTAEAALQLFLWSGHPELRDRRIVSDPALQTGPPHEVRFLRVSAVLLNSCDTPCASLMLVLKTAGNLNAIAGRGFERTTSDANTSSKLRAV